MAKRKPAKRKARKPAKANQPDTKRAKLIALLEGDGASLDAICKKFGWQKHTTRGIISILGKTSKIESTRMEKGQRFYRIAK